MRFTRNTYRHAIRRARVREEELHELYIVARDRADLARQLVPAIREGYLGLYRDRALIAYRRAVQARRRIVVRWARERGARRG